LAVATFYLLSCL